MNEHMKSTIKLLQNKQHILFLTTSNRWRGEKNDIPKSTMLAQKIAEKVGTHKVEIIDVPSLLIYPCEGNVSTKGGNSCGLLDAVLKNAEKNPSGLHRCWASINNPDDELWKISKALFASDAVVFFGSVRWGQMNSFYQKLIERLTWIENRHSTLGETNEVANIAAGVIAIGQNWRGEDVVATQKQVLSYFGFQTPDELSWNWQYTTESSDESPESYKLAFKTFSQEFLSDDIL